MHLYASFLLTLALVSRCRSLDVGRLPTMGWNSWNAFGCDVNETSILSAAKSIISLGLQDLGYDTIVLDDCWSMKTGRSNSTGRLLPNTTRFPDGISGLAKQIHGLGFRFGIYSTAGNKTCGGYPASLGYEEIDARTFAEWGVNFLKYDNCNVPEEWWDECQYCLPDELQSDIVFGPNGTCTSTTYPSADFPPLCPPGYNYTSSRTFDRASRMRAALDATDRQVELNLCFWGYADVQNWGRRVSTSWRSSDDIQPSWARVAQLINFNAGQLDHTDFYGHSDADMLEVGNNLTLAEARSHFALWAAMKSPLVLGTDLANLTKATLSVVMNKYLIDFNQDAVIGRPAKPYKWGRNPDNTFDPLNPPEYWAGDSSNGTLVLALNPTNDTVTKRADFTEIPGVMRGGMYRVIDVWTGQDCGCVQDGFERPVEPHDTMALLLKDDCAPTEDTDSRSKFS